jgi:hypothetical protein
MPDHRDSGAASTKAGIGIQRRRLIPARAGNVVVAAAGQQTAIEAMCAASLSIVGSVTERLHLLARKLWVVVAALAGEQSSKARGD